MALLRALAYFFQEAATSLWRSRLLNALSVGTIAVSLFVLGSFLTTAGALNEVVARWTQKVQVTFFLRDDVTDAVRQGLLDRLRDDPAVESVTPVSREEALQRFRALFHDLASLPDDLGQNPFPASLEATLRAGHQSPAEVSRLAEAYGRSAGVEEVQYDLVWIERLGAAVRLLRGLGWFLGGLLTLAGVFTISNVIRLTVYARQDELDIMRLVGATQAYVKGPFVAEGMLVGGLGGLLAVVLLWAALRLLSGEVLLASDLLGRAHLGLPGGVAAVLVAGGTLVGLVGSLVTLGRQQV